LTGYGAYTVFPLSFPFQVFVSNILHSSSLRHSRTFSLIHSHPLLISLVLTLISSFPVSHSCKEQLCLIRVTDCHSAFAGRDFLRFRNSTHSRANNRHSACLFADPRLCGNEGGPLPLVPADSQGSADSIKTMGDDTAHETRDGSREVGPQMPVLAQCSSWFARRLVLVRQPRVVGRGRWR
jgi:hypothetical protein